MNAADISFPALGTDVRLIGTGVERARDWLEDFEARLSRFRPDSELCLLNADPRLHVPASRLLRFAVGAALWAARRTGGLVDPTLGTAIVRLGYTRSLRDHEPVPLTPHRREPARPADGWRRVAVTAEGIRRPRGVHIDLGGTGKGLAADRMARMIGGTADCGGDVRVVGTQEVHVLHPHTRECCQLLRITDGAVATSGIERRTWRDDSGEVVHHLLDPATGRPAWTGIVSATALAPTALEAEALAKAALLTADGAQLVHGGVLVHDDGDVEVVRR